MVKDILGFEPLVSLKGGPDGSAILIRVIKKSSNLIKIGGAKIKSKVSPLNNLSSVELPIGAKGRLSFTVPFTLSNGGG